MSSTPPAFDIVRKPFESPVRDVMDGSARWEIKVHDHGMIALVDAMPRLVPQDATADAAIVQAARVSYGQGTKKVNEDRGLIRYLLRHRHTTQNDPDAPWPGRDKAPHRAPANGRRPRSLRRCS